MPEVNFLVKNGLTVPKGSASTPAVIFDASDSNTGIYSPGADQVAISTGGSGRVTVTSTGVGIGTSSPAFPLQINGSACVAGTSDDIFFGVDDNTSPRLGLVKQAGNSPLFAAGSATAFVFAHSSGTSISSPSTQTYTERVRIDSSGRLLVGTSSALTNIYTGATAATPQVQLSGAGLNESSLSLLRTGPTGATVFLNAGSSGNTVLSSSILGRFIFNGFDGTNYRTGGQIVCEVDGTPGTNDMPGRLVFSTTADGASSPIERLRVTSAGYVGIGTTTPSEALVVARLDNDLIARFGSLTTNTGASIRLQGRDAAGVNNQFWDIRNNVDGSLSFNGSSFLLSERVRIDSSGRLLVGTSSGRVVEPFGVSTEGVTPHIIESVTSSDPNKQVLLICANSNTTAANGAALTLARSRGNALGSSTLVQNGDNLGTIGFAGSDGLDILSKGAAIYAEVDGTASLNDMPGRLVFSTTADGANIPTERLRITSAGRVGIGTTNPNISSLLDVTSTTQGFLPPRMTTTQRNAISSPAAGLMVYNTTTNKLNFYNGTAWEAVTSA